MTPTHWNFIKEAVLENHGHLTIYSGLQATCHIWDCKKPAKQTVRIPIGSGHSYCADFCKQHVKEIKQLKNTSSTTPTET